MKTKKAYDEIFAVLDKYKDDIVFDISSLKQEADLHLFAIELNNKYGLNVSSDKIHSLGWNKFGDHVAIGRFGAMHNRTISWEVNDRQPVDELLIKISFPTGPYIFGDGDMFNKDYPTDFFKKFWSELKAYNPDYIDEMNHALYWKVENAKDIFNSFNDILSKYHALNREDIKQRRIQKMKEELAKLEEKSN